MLNYTIGAVKRKKSTAKKKTTTKKVSPVTKEVIKLKEIYFGKKKTKAPAKKKYTVSTTCSSAGTELKKKRTTKAGGILALCRASVKNLNTTASALKKYGVSKGKLSRKK